MATNQEMMSSDEFNNAILEGVEYKKNIMTTYKQQNKTNLERFYEVMLESNPEIRDLLSKKRKNRTDADEAAIKSYKKSIGQVYRQTQDLCIEENLEDGLKTKFEKIVEKVAPVINMLRYIGNSKLDDEFAKHGIHLLIDSKLEDVVTGLDSDEKRAVMRDIFNNAKQIKKRMLDDADKIASEVFLTKVPVDLQYDKDRNNTGLKQNDFMKLVDLKTKLVMATSEEAKEKVNETIENLAGEKQFEAARAELVRDKLTTL